MNDLVISPLAAVTVLTVSPDDFLIDVELFVAALELSVYDFD